MEIDQTNINLENNELFEKIIKSPYDFLKQSSNEYLKDKEFNRETLVNFKISEILKNINFINYLDHIPDLTFTQISNNGSLVKFHYMPQNIIENQLYVSATYLENDIIFTKYCETDYNEELDEDLLYDNKNTILLERLLINAVQIPGMTEWVKKDLGTNTFKNKILLYEYENENIKVNEERLVIGLVYKYDETVIIHSWMNLKNIISKPSLIEIFTVRDDLFKIFSNLTNDKLISEYLIIFLTSQLYARNEDLLLGKITLNIKGKDQILSKMIIDMINEIVHYHVNLEITINSLNKQLYAPRFDPNTDELVQGVLQTVNHSIITINELNLESGNLDQMGLKNWENVRNLINFQSMIYDYPYSKVEIFHNNPILIFSEKKSLFHSESSMIEIYIKEKCNHNNDQYDYTDIRKWFGAVRYSEYINKFKIEKEVNDLIIKDCNTEGFKYEEFDLIMKLSKIYSISKGLDHLRYEDYNYIKELERERKIRILNN